MIILNQGVIANLAYVFRSTFAFMTWNDAVSFCKDASQDDYGRAIIGLAYAVVFNDTRYLKPHRRTLEFPSLCDYDPFTSAFCLMMELFILVHEYAHYLLGHLSLEHVEPALGLDSEVLREYSKSQVQEFEADRYAVEAMLRSCTSRPIIPSDVACSAGLLLKFFELCELVRPPLVSEGGTHPPARKRWERIQELTGLAEAPNSIASHLDSAFEVLFCALLTDRGDGLLR